MTYTGSSLLDEIFEKRAAFNKKMYPRRVAPSVRVPTGLPLVRMEPEKSVAERVAEAKRFSGKLPAWKVNKIINCILACNKIAPKISPLMVANIQAAVAEYFDIPIEEMLSTNRRQYKVFPRHIAMYLARTLTSQSCSGIGQKFGMGHVAVVHATKRITRLIAMDAAFAEEIEALKKSLVS